MNKLSIFKKILYFILDNFLISDVDNSKHIKCNQVRDGYSFTPVYSNTESNLARYKNSNLPKKFYIGPQFFYELKNISLIGPYGIPVTKRGRIIVNVHGETYLKCIRRTVAKMGVFKFLICYLKAVLPLKKYQIESGFHLVPRHGYDANKPNYCHWILENLPQLYSLKHIEGNLKIIVNESLTKWQSESLSELGYNKKHISNINPAENTNIKKFYFSTLQSASSQNSDRDPIGRAWVKQAMSSSSTMRSNSIKKRIFLSRQDMPRGHITNMEKLEPIFKEHNVEIFYPGLISFKNDLDLFRDVELIIAPHGAGMANMIFSNNCHVIEIVCGKKLNADFFYMTALECGHTFNTILAKRDYYYESSNKLDEAWTVNPLDLTKAIIEYSSCQR